MEHGRQNLNLQLYFTTNNTDERKKNRQVDQTFLGLCLSSVNLSEIHGHPAI
jgi:hypothetical protein